MGKSSWEASILNISLLKIRKLNLHIYVQLAWKMYLIDLEERVADDNMQSTELRVTQVFSDGVNHQRDSWICAFCYTNIKTV